MAYIVEKIIDAELPEEYKDGILYILCEGANFYTAIMKCPCGCGELFHLNLNNSISRPRWKINFKNGKPTIRPSILRLKGCKSHFFINNGEVKFC